MRKVFACLAIMLLIVYVPCSSASVVLRGGASGITSHESLKSDSFWVLPPFRT